MIKKYILFLLIFCSYNIIHCQDTNGSTTKVKKKLITSGYPYFSIFSVFGGSSVLPNSGAPIHSTPNTWLILAGYIPVNHDKIYLYTQFRTSFYLGESSFPLSAVQPIMHMENTKVGVLLGLGGIIKDWRKNDIGWHFRINGGITFEGGVANSFLELEEDRYCVWQDRFLNIGVEIDTIFYYNTQKHFALNIGIHLSYQISPYSGDSFYMEDLDQKAYIYFHYMTYGISFGVSF